MINENNVRIDKWLWAVRIYKTRSQATKACNAGKVKIEGQAVKASKIIKRGDEITIRKKEGLKIVKVQAVILKRVKGLEAIKCYEDKSPQQKNESRLPSVFYGMSSAMKKGGGRPTKKERRQLDKFRKR